MLAGRLALEWGIVDVRGWLSSLPRGALDFWEAFDMVEPIGERWRQAAMVAHQSSLGTYCNAGQKPPDLDDFMPARYKRRKPTVEPVKPATEQFKDMLKIVGLNGNND